MNARLSVDPSTPILAQIRAMLENDDRSGAVALFRRTVEPLELGRLAPRRQAQLTSAAVWIGDAGFVTSLLKAVHGDEPYLDVAIAEPVAVRGGVQGVLCQATGGGWRFTIPFPSKVSAGAGIALLQLMLRFLQAVPLFVEAARAGLTRDGEVLLNLADAARFGGVGYCANSDIAGLIPDPDFMLHRGYADFLQLLKTRPIAWNEREKVAFWRGATTGRSLPGQPGWETLHRVQLCQIVQCEQAALFDVGLSRIQLPAGSSAHQELRARGYMRPFTRRMNLQKYRYHVDIDGYVSAWSALFTKLATGCPVLKVGSREHWRQWYYDRLVPWENYVPVQTDLSDLVEKTTWLIEHDDDAQRIGAAGRALALSLTYDSQLRAGAETIAGRIRTPGRTAPCS